jgi:hypothetical protein
MCIRDRVNCPDSVTAFALGARRRKVTCRSAMISGEITGAAREPGPLALRSGAGATAGVWAKPAAAPSASPSDTTKPASGARGSEFIGMERGLQNCSARSAPTSRIAPPCRSRQATASTPISHPSTPPPARARAPPARFFPRAQPKKVSPITGHSPPRIPPARPTHPVKNYPLCRLGNSHRTRPRPRT